MTALVRIALLALVVSACGGRPPPRDAGAVTADMGAPQVGDCAPDFTLVDQSGARVKLSDLRGHVVVLHFGASWCPFCTAELPNLARLQDEYAARDVKVVLVDVADEDAAFHEYSTRVPLHFPMVRDRDGGVSATFAPPGALRDIANRSQVVIASNLLVDRDGTIRFFTLVDLAHFDAKLVALRRDLDALLAGAE